MKALFKKIHLWLSLPLGLVISVICLTGAILVFEQDITRALQRELYTVTPPEEGAQPMPPSALAAGIMARMADSALFTAPGAPATSRQTLELTSIQIPGDPGGSALVSFRQTGRSQLAVNPYTGEILGWTQSYPFFQTVKKIHRWLMDPPPSKGQKSAGKIIVGISTVVMVVILLSGLVIWIPRNRKALKNRLRVSINRGWHRFWYDSHVALGFYATVFLLVMALTGLTWSFGWYRDAAYSLFGANDRQAPASAAQPGSTQVRQQQNQPLRQEQASGSSLHQTQADSHQPAQRQLPEYGFDYQVWDKAVSELKDAYPVYKTMTLNEKTIQIIPDLNAVMRKADIITFDPVTGEVTDISPYSERPRSQTIKGWFYAFHTGSWGGMVTKILYFLAALIGGILPITGYYLWWKRICRRRT